MKSFKQILLVTGLLFCITIKTENLTDIQIIDNNKEKFDKIETQNEIIVVQNKLLEVLEEANITTENIKNVIIENDKEFILLLNQIIFSLEKWCEMIKEISDRIYNNIIPENCYKNGYISYDEKHSLEKELISFYEKKIISLKEVIIKLQNFKSNYTYYSLLKQMKQRPFDAISAVCKIFSYFTS